MKNLFFMCDEFHLVKIQGFPICALLCLFVFSLLKLCFVIWRSWSSPMFNIHLFNKPFLGKPKRKKEKEKEKNHCLKCRLLY